MIFTWFPTFLFDHHGVRLKLPILSITGMTWTLFFIANIYPTLPLQVLLNLKVSPLMSQQFLKLKILKVKPCSS